MGSSTYSEVCKNVVYIGDFNGLLYDHDGVLPHRWALNKSMRQYGELICDTFEKTIKYKNGVVDVLHVHIVNTSPYANGGEECYVAFSDRLKSIKRFCKDFDITDDIEKVDSVHQTL